jgi:cytochrome P450
LRVAMNHALAFRPDVDLIREAEETMHAFASRVFARAEENPAQVPVDSLIHLLLAKDPKSNLPYYPPAIRYDELMTFMFAGHETTANTLAWSMYALAKHPDVQQKVYEEIVREIAALTEKNESLAYQNMLRFKYLTKVINEVMRLYPVVANGTFRQLQVDDVVHDNAGREHVVKAGVVVNFPHWVVHRSPLHWGDDANKFNPDRKWNEKAFMPFTKPARDCLGRNLASSEIRVALIIILQEFEIARGWNVSEDEDEYDEGFNTVTLQPRFGPRLRFLPRKK